MSSRPTGRVDRCQHVTFRRGSTLIELIIVISLSVMMMGVVSVFLRIMFQSSSGARQDANMQASIARLSDAFRADVHRAEQAIPRGDSLLLKTPSGSTIHYQSTKDGVKRDETMAIGRLSERDIFRLPAVWKVRWDSDTAGQGRLVGLNVELRDEQESARASVFGTLEIRAALAGPFMEFGDSVRTDETDQTRIE